jgi:pyridoxal phosphate enzyme (YggS family)
MFRARNRDGVSDVKTRVALVRERIDGAAIRSRRRPEEVTIVAITKGVELDAIALAVAAGITDLGESKVQEAMPKVAAVATPPGMPHVRWHMVGHLQRNKARQTIGIFSVTHSVDSVHLAAALSSHAAAAKRSIDILLQVNVAGEPGKFGIAPRDTVSFVREIGEMPSLRVVGLMTIAPQTEDPESVRPVFRRLRELRDEVRSSGISGGEFVHLSMGMTDDFEVAIEEGATMVRIGRAIFGERT